MLYYGNEIVMKEICLFLASSIVTFEKERNELGNYIRQLNNIYAKRGIYFRLDICEDISNALSDMRKQDEYNEKVRNSQFFYILIGDNAGKYTMEEFNIALKQNKMTGFPRIYTYFQEKKNNNYTDEIMSFMKRLDNELGHYYTVFSHIDSVKLNILLELARDPEIGGMLSLVNGVASIDGSDLLDIKDMPLYANNDELRGLHKQLKEAEEEYLILMEMYKINSNAAVERLIEKNEQTRYKLQEQLNRIESEMLKLYQKIAEIGNEGEPLNWREKKAIEAIGEGNQDVAIKLLSDPVWEREISILQDNIDGEKQSIARYIKGKKMLIGALSVKGIQSNVENKIIEIYEDLFKMCKRYLIDLDSLYDYALFMMNHNRHEKAKTILEDLLCVYEHILNVTDMETIASAEYLLACIKYKLNDRDEARRLHESAIEKRVIIASEGGYDARRKLAISYNQYGYLLYRMNYTDESHKYLLNAIQIYKSIMNSEYGFDVNTIKKEYALSLNNLSLVEQELGNLQVVESLHIEAMNIRKELAKDNTVASLGFLAMSYLNYARFMFATKTSSIDVAEEYAKNAVELYSKISKKDTKYKNDVAIAEYYLANIIGLYDKQESLEMHRRVLNSRRMMAETNYMARKSDLMDSLFAVGKLMSELNIEGADDYISEGMELKDE